MDLSVFYYERHLDVLKSISLAEETLNYFYNETKD